MRYFVTTPYDRITLEFNDAGALSEYLNGRAPGLVYQVQSVENEPRGNAIIGQYYDRWRSQIEDILKYQWFNKDAAKNLLNAIACINRDHWKDIEAYKKLPKDPEY